ncbi:MAG: hypothetical protein ACRDZO_28525 [Egibacteraceae bacterium]
MMARDSHSRRGDLPILLTSLVTDPNATDVATWLRDHVAKAAHHRM